MMAGKQTELWRSTDIIPTVRQGGGSIMVWVWEIN